MATKLVSDSRCLKLYRTYSISFNSSNVGKCLRSWTLKALSKSRKRKRKSLSCVHVLHKTNIMIRRWNHNVILFRGISRLLSAVWRRWFPGQSGDLACLVLLKRLVISFARPFQLLPSACADIPLTLSWNFFPPPPQSPTCHRLHLLIVLSSLVCRKYSLICGRFLSPPFLKRC